MAWALVNSVAFAFVGLFSKLASGTVHWSVFGLSRGIFGILLAVVLARTRGSSLKVKNVRGAWLRSIFGTAAMACAFAAFASKALPLADASTLYSLSPVFLAVLAPVVLRERLTLRVVTVLAVSIVGVVLITKPSTLLDGGFLEKERLIGSLLALGAALCAAMSMLLLRRQGQTETPEAIMLHFSTVAAGAHLVISLFYLRTPSLRDLGYTAIMGMFTAVSQYAMTRAYALERAAYVGAIGYTNVVFSALLGILVFHQAVGARAIAGMLAISAAGLLILLRSPAAPAPKPKVEAEAPRT
jgi:drug/metabolite transporter (DMT)-like permease